jgi:hypothetical protein
VDSKRDHPTVVEVLSAYVREHAHPRRPASPGTLKNSLSEQALYEKPAVDVQAALTILGRLPARFGISRGDLSSSNLAGADLNLADLSGADLHRADLSNASLREADLTGAVLIYANFTYALLDQANLTGAILYRADMRRAELLRQEQVDSAVGDELTPLPPKLKRPVSWVGDAVPIPILSQDEDQRL